MVQKWIKQLNSLKKISKIDFDKIIVNILDWKAYLYDVKKMNWYNDLYRVRIWKYRIIFEDAQWNINILLIWQRENIYKWL
jgi:mRNA-degrading endonuclease RelE of RelBE toxin-antitoxin system